MIKSALIRNASIELFYIILISHCSFPSHISAGLDRFTRWELFEGWIIERKVNSADYSIRCRASKVNNYAWFGGRVRLDKNDNLIGPVKGSLIQGYQLEKIKKSLRHCRSSIIN